PMRWTWICGRGIVDEVHGIDRPGMHLMFCEGAELPPSLQSFFGGYEVVLSYRPDPEGIFAGNLRRLGIRHVLSQPPFPPPPPPKVHVADFALKLMTEVDVRPLPELPPLPVSAAERARMEPFFAAHAIDPSRNRLAVLYPGGGSVGKRWPIERFATLARALAEQGGVRIIISMGYAEETLADRLLPLLDPIHPVLLTHWPLADLIPLMEYAAVVIGNDSGLTHLSAALGRPTVAIFGPTDPEIWGPRGARVSIVQMEGEQAAEEPSPTAGEGALHPDVLRVLQAARQWLDTSTLTRSRDDRWGRS
ncbi:MAG: glycosyltransferase family 9 protein, partial [Candidatus Entotheonellia bacterium]